MAEIFLCPKGTVNAADRKALRKSGIVVVEVDRPEECKFIRSTAEISDQAFMWALLRGLNHNGGYGNTGVEQREKFVKALFEQVQEQRQARLDAEVADQPKLDSSSEATR